MQPIRKSQLIWLTVTNGSTLSGAFIPFPDQPDLRGKWIDGIEAIDAKSLVATPDGVEVYGSEASCMLTLFEGSTQRHKDISIALLDPTNTAGIWKSFTPFQVNWQRSGVRVMEPLASNLLSIPFVVHYFDE